MLSASRESSTSDLWHRAVSDRSASCETKLPRQSRIRYYVASHSRNLEKERPFLEEIEELPTKRK
jgi:hypothetical protein